VAGLCLERHGGPVFDEEEKRAAASLAVSYGIAWRPFRRRALIGSRRRRALAWAGGVLLALLLLLLPVPLRVVAPCEVVPDAPVAVAAPMDGVVREVLVRPGARVAEGDPVARYDGREAREARAVAAEQVGIIRADLRRARVKAFENAEDRAALRLLENRLAREEEMLARAERRVRDLEVRAPAAGTVVLDDPDAWRGRPAATGERICMIVDPARTRAVLWLPVDDRVDFPEGTEVSVLLTADPRSRRAARLRYVAPESAPGPDGAPAFRAEADWRRVARTERVPPGLQGTAVLHGERVPLGYWLVRRPVAWLRSTCGL
jgi:multidrug efflux pump subunit AcrA (membrane-fusion protein)